MTKDEAIATAIATLENIKQFGIDKWMFDKEEIEAFDMAIKALQAQTDGDLIRRADAIEAVENLQTEQWIDSDTDYNNGLQSAIAEIRALPSADRPSGEWIKHNDRISIIFYYTCSECGEVESGTPPYCRNCGAKMGGNK